MELQVGRPGAAVGAGEQERLGDRRGQRPAPPQQPVEQRARLLAVGERAADRRLPDADAEGVVLEVGADPGKLDRGLDPGRFELAALADAGQHQQLRGADRAGREHDLLARPHGRRGRLAGELDAADALAVELEPDRRDPGGDRQVRQPLGRAQERVCGAPAPPLALRHLDHADPGRLAVVVVVVGRVAGGAAGADHQVGELARAPRRRDVQQPAVAVGRRGARLMVLGADEVGQHLVPAPAGAAVLVAPTVIVGAMAAHVEHRVHRARAAERLAARHVELAVVAAGLGPGREVPVELGPELLRERRRDLDLR